MADVDDTERVHIGETCAITVDAEDQKSSAAVRDEVSGKDQAHGGVRCAFH